VDEHYSYQDVASVMAITDCYSTAEPHVDAVCDVYVQKIGPHYRAYVYVRNYTHQPTQPLAGRHRVTLVVRALSARSY